MSKAPALKSGLCNLDLDSDNALYQLNTTQLIEEALLNGEGSLADSGALVVDTGKFTGRSPRDRFIVCDDITRDTVWWGEVNIKFEEEKFDALVQKITKHIGRRKYYVRDGYACADDKYRIGIRVITETAYQNLFACNLFLRSDIGNLSLQPEWTIIASPSFFADPSADGTRQPNFTVLSFKRKLILIGGTGYTGEIKKGIFSALNFILPQEHGVLPMHCSANKDKAGDTAIFFGLSGTGKTTLSADPERGLIGDDEHGWGPETVFNFEGGCYAKCVDLSREKEPQIFNAVKFGALLENVHFFPGTRQVNFSDIGKTENTRVAYPVHFIDNAVVPSTASAPKNIFFLTADAFGVLPPISKLDAGQAMFHFISGYTAKVAGTETGVLEPQVTFSACFGKAFLPLHPMRYAELFGTKMKERNVNVWLVNTGWLGGAYGSGQRIRLSYTRAMISAALNNVFDETGFSVDPVFGLKIPRACPGVPAEILDPGNMWPDKQKYEVKARELSIAFNDNFKQFASFATSEMAAALPKVNENKV